jgi:ADP-ribose pyrophosphatase YjhB (NUDIX family)
MEPRTPPPTLADIDARALRLERDRRALLDAAAAAHIDGGVSANNLARTLGETLFGPGWGRDRIRALLAAARNERVANDALAAAGLPRSTVAAWADLYDEGHAGPALLCNRTPGPLEVAVVRQTLDALAGVGLTLDVPDPAAALAALAFSNPGLPITRLTAPAPGRAHRADQDRPHFCTLNLIVLRGDHDVLAVQCQSDPYRGLAALPGRDVPDDKTAVNVGHVARAADAIGLNIDHEAWYFLGSYQDHATDPRGHVTNIAWAVAVPEGTPAPEGTDWADAGELLTGGMAYDHAWPLADAYRIYRKTRFKTDRS